MTNETAERIFAVIAPVIREGKQPGSIASISRMSGVPQDQTRDALAWMAEIGWVLRDRPDGKGAWQYGLPAEEYVPEDSPDVPLHVDMVLYSSELETARYGIGMLQMLIQANPRDIGAIVQKGEIQHYADERRRFNSVHSERQGGAKGMDLSKMMTFIGYLYRKEHGQMTPADVEFGRTRRKPMTCTLCDDVYFERDAQQDICYACEAALPIPEAR